MYRKKVKRYNGIPVVYRPNTSDERALREVVDQRTYRKASIRFDVEEGERWLDLGAAVGAFAVYCKLRGAAMVDCYEPEAGCYGLLSCNVGRLGFQCHNSAVTHVRVNRVAFYTSCKEGQLYRGTTKPVRGYEWVGNVKNKWAGELKGLVFDGVKLDIEGSEGPLIDEWLLPRCSKLVLEYHTSRDNRVSALEKRLGILKDKFALVKYPPEYDKLITGTYGRREDCNCFRDRMIFCMNPK